MSASGPSVKAVFDRAIEIDSPAERAAYLDEACAGGPDLRQKVEALLRAYADAGSFLELPSPSPTDATGTFDPKSYRPAAAPAGFGGGDVTGTFGATPPTDSYHSPAVALGETVGGRYTLVDVIGEGGMGWVYLAVQTEPVKRQVALKLIKTGMDSKAVLARFDAERQALALMDHPNIARIYDGGVTPQGQPYFVMELVQGEPLTEYCDKHKLSVAARLQLFVSVCQAVQHAHQKGIIHRDIKPSNVLVTEVDGKPTPKVIDFGVAKATELKLTDLSIADVGAIVGTPAYMSPEQADPTSMDVDTRTDVYALGVMLYELLTGSPPVDAKQFKRGAVLEMLRMVREVEPPRPSTKLSTAGGLQHIASNRSIEPAKLARLLQGELDWVVMKAIEKDRTRRYETANGLGRDLERYLTDEVVEARPPSAGYRLKKFVRRHKGQVVAAALVMFVLLAGMAGTTWGLVEAKWQEQEAKNQAHEAELQKQEARRQEAVANEQRQIAEEKTKEVKAYGLVQLVLNVDTPKVPPVLDELAPYRRWVDPLLRAVPDRSPQKLHASLALLPADPGQVDYLFGQLLEADPKDALPVIRDALASHKDRLCDKLWAAVEKPEPGKESHRLRAAAALAKYDPDSPRWARAKGIVNDLMAAPAAGVTDWKEALRPVRLQLLESLSVVYHSGNRPPAERSRATEILADYAADQPQLLADLLAVADEKQFAVICAKLKDHGERAVPLLASHLGPAPGAAAVKTDWAVRFYKWQPLGKPSLGISDFYVAPGARIASILQGGAAQRAGLKPYDAILAVGGKNTTFPRDVIVEVQQYKIGDKVVLKVARAGKTMDVEVTLGAEQADQSPSDWGAVLNSPVLDELRIPVLQLPSVNGRPTPKVPEEYFAAVATTAVPPGEGEYEFTITYDDGVRVRLDDELVFENWKANAPTTTRIPVRLKRGKQFIKVEFFQASASYVLDGELAVSNDSDRLARRRVNAAVALLRMNQPEPAGQLLRHSPDPTARSYLIHRLGSLGADAATLVKQLDKEPDPAIRRALLLSLGEFSEKAFSPDDRKALVPKVRDLYRTAPDPGLHAASEWLLRTWKEDAWLKQVNEEWAKEQAQRDARLKSIEQTTKTDKSPHWYVNGQGQTLVVVPGPVEFWMGSPAEEDRRVGGAEELRHWRRIGRSFAIANKEVTKEQFLRFRKDHPVDGRAAPSDDCPVNNVTWYDAAAYCNFLSEQEGIPRDQWCYEPNEKGEYGPGMKLAPNYLQRTGYRLPTAAEWEYAYRGGTTTRFFFGKSEELLPKYGWFAPNSQGRLWPVGILKPNDLGLFDMPGNVLEWCQEPHGQYAIDEFGTPAEDIEAVLDVLDAARRSSRGGSGLSGQFPDLRAARRTAEAPFGRHNDRGFRPVRTLPLTSPGRYAAARTAATAEPGKEPVNFRRQALDFLKAELAQWSAVQPPRAFVARNLWRWQNDRALAGVRDEAALAKLPPEERKAFARFWADVAKAAEPANGAERVEFARIAVLIAAVQGKDEPPFDDAAKTKLRQRAFDWLKSELPLAADRAGKAAIIAAAAPLPDLLEKLAESAPNDGPFHAELAGHYAERGDAERTNAARTKARALFEAQLAKEPDNAALAAELADLLLIDSTRWTRLRPALMKSDKGATFSVLPDGSILVGGAAVVNDRYRVEFTVEKEIDLAALRVEALTHDSLPGRGPGRYPGRDPANSYRGTFAQMSWIVTATLPNRKDPVTLEFDNGVTNLFPISSKGAWTIAGGGEGRDCSAVSPLASPVTLPAGTVLAFELQFGGLGSENLGRFRLSSSSDQADLGRHEKRFAAKKLADPWASLAAAYVLDGRIDKGLGYFGKAFQRAGDRAGRAAVLAAAAPFPGLLEQLAAAGPNDGCFQAGLAHHYAERGDAARAGAARAKARTLFEAQLAKEPDDATATDELALLLLTPRAQEWGVLKPTATKPENGAKLTPQDDGSILIEPAPKAEPGTVRWQLDPKTAKALRIETGPPAKGAPAFTEYQIVSAGAATSGTLRGRFVRLDLPGDSRQFPRHPQDGDRKVINLAELQVFRGDQNIALRRKARQSSDHDGPRLPADRAVDGNTVGNDTTNSYAHTMSEDDPWWEVDLGSEQAIDRLVVWNRVEAGTHTRMNHFRVRVLDQSRTVVFEQVVDNAPNPSTELVPPAFVTEPKGGPAGENQTLILRLPLRDASYRVRLSAGAALDAESNARRAAGLKLAGPRLRLAAAYAVNGRNDRAAEYYAHALRLDPKLGDDLKAQHRYNGACYSALAAAGQEADAPKLDDAAKAKLRRQALDWLTAELTAWTRAFDSGPPQDRPVILRTLSWWWEDTDLAGVRDEAALAELPAGERKQWRALWARVPEQRILVPTSREQGQLWRYTTQQPAESWEKADFDDKPWQEGLGGFGGGVDRRPVVVIRTPWNTADIWLRREFTLPEGTWDDLLLLIFHDDDAEVYINGVLALKVPRSRDNYAEVPISAEARKALKPGNNVFAVHCHDIGGFRFIDVGIGGGKGNAGRLALAQIAADRKRFTFATELWAEALARDPKLGDDRGAQRRYSAARAAAQAALGLGEVETPPDDATKAKLRGQAHDWLRAELTAWAKLLGSRAEYRPFVARALVTWQSDAALAAIRDDAALKKLPADEQKAFAQLWGDVAGTLQKCKAKVEILKAEYGAGDRWKDVTEVLRKHVGELPLITLPSLDPFPYNQSFGDPLPAVQKQLKIQYTIDGTPGEVVLPQNAPITLPVGKGDLGSLQFPRIPPFTDADVKRIAAMPAAEQVEAVRKELKKCNPEFAGKFEAVVEKDQVVGLDLATDGLTDLSPVRAFTRLQRLTCAGLPEGTLTDLGPLRGLPLRVLEVHGNAGLTDLTPLAGMKLELLNLWGWGGSDLTPLKGMPLKWLNCAGSKQKLDLAPLAGSPLETLMVNATQVSDLAPLRDTRLRMLDLRNTKVSDLSPLKGMPLAELFFEGAAVTDLGALKDLALKKLSCDFRAERDAIALRAIKTLEEINGVSAEKFWKEVDEKNDKKP